LIDPHFAGTFSATREHAAGEKKVKCGIRPIAILGSFPIDDIEGPTD
jgi:hypothetical protein